MSDVQPPIKPSIWRVVKDQRKIELVALGLMVASFWVAGAAGEWRLAGCIAGGVFLGLVNHLVDRVLAAPDHLVRRAADPQPDDRVHGRPPRPCSRWSRWALL